MPIVSVITLPALKFPFGGEAAIELTVGAVVDGHGHRARGRRSWATPPPMAAAPGTSRPGVASGAHSLTATATDAAGNASSASSTMAVTIDTTAPTVSSIAASPPNGNFNAGSVITLTIGMSENVTVNTSGGSPTLTLNDGGTATYVSGSGTNSLVFSYTVLAGQNTPDLKVSAVNLNGATLQDVAGNAANLSISGVAQGSPAIDTIAPVAPSITSFSPDSGIVGDGITNATVLTLTGTAEANSTVKVYDGATLLGSASVNGSGAWTYTTGTLANGAHSLAATATDAAGNVSAASSAMAVTIDTTSARGTGHRQ